MSYTYRIVYKSGREHRVISDLPKHKMVDQERRNLREMYMLTDETANTWERVFRQR